MRSFIKYLPILFVVLACVCVSCTNSQTPIRDLNALCERVQNDGDKFTADDWQAAALEYARIDSLLGTYEYSREEQDSISRLKGRFVAITAKKSLENLGNTFEELSNSAANALDGFLDEMAK